MRLLGWLLACVALAFFFFFFFNDTATTEIYTLSYTTLFRSHCFHLPPDRRLETSQLDHDDSDTKRQQDRKSTRLNSSHTVISYAVFCLKKKKSSVPLNEPTPDRGGRDLDPRPMHPSPADAPQ